MAGKPKQTAAKRAPGPAAKRGSDAGPARPTGPRLVDNIVVRPVADLVPYANNARTHSKKQVAQIAASIREFGFTNPVLVDDQGGIVAGHGRVMAAQKLGLQAVPTIDVGYLTEAQRKAYVLADNRIALSAGWDEELLAVELLGIRDLGMDVEVIGFSTNELNRAFGTGGTADPQLGDDLNYQVVIECAGEADQEALLERLRAEGLKCRPLIL